MGASHMTISHNSLIRGFNSIYQQAPRISASDYKDFKGYCLAWHRCVEQHHMHEEVNYFPEIEKVTGQKGVMDGEVEQHGRTISKLTQTRKFTDPCPSRLPRRAEKLQGLLVESQESRVGF